MAFDDGVKTVSGSIAHTDDAAAKVPFVSVKCGIQTTLTGVSEVLATQTGANLLNFPNFILNFGVTNSAEVENSANFPVGQYTITFDIPTNTTTKTATFVIRDKKGAGATQQAVSYISAGSTASKTITFTATMPFNYFYCYMSSSETTGSTISIENIMMVSGATSSPYVSPTAPTTYTASLGRTIHGGTADIVKGVGVDNTTRIQIKDRTWTITEVGTSFKVFTCNKITTKEANFNFQVEGYENAETYRNYLQDKQCGTYNTTNAMDRIVIRDDSYTTVEDFLTAVGDNYIVFENTTPTDFTFTPITPTPESVGKVNNVYCNTGDTELTYHDNAHGFAEVTVTRCGKNLADMSKIEQGSISSRDGGNINATTRVRTNYVKVNGGETYSFSMGGTANIYELYQYDKNGAKLTFNTINAQTTVLTTRSDCAYVRFIMRYSNNTTITPSDIVNLQIEKSASPTAYEPYSGVSQTAYLHKVIYGGTADVVKGTCEPKNLIQLYTRASNNGVDYSINEDGSLHRSGLATANSYNNGNASSYENCPYKFSAGTYTITVSGSTTETDYVSFGIITKSGTSMSAQNVYGNSSKTFTINEDFGTWYWCKISSGVTVDDNVYIWLEKGSSSTEYAPHFEPFTFPPISIGTDEGENTLFANEGDSAITYRKAVD